MKILDRFLSPVLYRRLLTLLTWAVVAPLIAACATATLTSSQQVAELSRLIRTQDYQGASELIRRYPDSLDDKRGLSVAVRVGDPEGVKYFAKRVGVDARLDLDDTTALIDSVTRAPPAARANVAKTLLDLGADPDREDKFGRSAGSLAERRNETALLELMERYVNQPNAAGPSRMLSWFPANRKLSLLAQSGDRAGPAGAIPAGRGGAKGRKRGVAGGASGGPLMAAEGGSSVGLSIGSAAGPSAGTAAGSRAGATVGPTLGPPGAKPAVNSISFSGRSDSPPAAISPAFLMKSVWLPAPEAGRNAPLAAFRFHVDGTGELLRYLARDKRSETVSGASLAWEFRDGKLRFFVLGEEFSALCESAAISDHKVDIACTDYSRAVGQATGASGEAKVDNARVLLDRRAGRRLALRNAATVTTELSASVEPGCRARPGAQLLGAGSAKRNSVAADWFAFSPSRFEAVSPASGLACRPPEAERRAMNECRKGSRDCRSVAGCLAGEVSAVAALSGHSGAWVGCDTDLKEARRKALETCRASAGCDCTLIAMNGQNINLARQPMCGR